MIKDVYKRQALCRDVDNIVGVKEASGNFSAIATLMSLSDGKVDLYSGNDDQIAVSYTHLDVYKRQYLSCRLYTSFVKLKRFKYALAIAWYLYYDKK